MKHLGDFSYFDWVAFSKDKVFKLISCNPWKDANTQRMLGTKIEVVIIEDHTKYETKESETKVSNVYEKLTFKVQGDALKELPEDSIVQAVDVKATIYGDYRNQLSIKCKDVIVVKPAKEKQEPVKNDQK